jgi:hypothetical protein
MAQKRSWDIERERKKLAYLFRAYVQVREPAWHVRSDLLDELARRCGEHFRWGETVHVGPALERQEWAIFGFREHERKLQFDAGLPAVMAVAIAPVESVPLPNGFADPDRDFSDLARRMAGKPHRGQWR